MPLAEAYRKQVALLIKIVPLVAAEPAFALWLTCEIVPLGVMPERFGKSANEAVIFAPRTFVEIVIHKAKRKYAVERTSAAIAEFGYELAVVGRKHNPVMSFEGGCV